MINVTLNCLRLRRKIECCLMSFRVECQAAVSLTTRRHTRCHVHFSFSRRFRGDVTRQGHFKVAAATVCTADRSDDRRPVSRVAISRDTCASTADHWLSLSNHEVERRPSIRQAPAPTHFRPGRRPITQRPSHPKNIPSATGGRCAACNK